MRLLCILAGDPDHPSGRFRILQHADRLRSRGIVMTTFVAKRRSLVDHALMLRQARDADAILIQKKLFAPWKLRTLPRSVPLLFDMDDAYFAASPDERERFGAARAERRARSRGRRLRAVLRRCRRAIVGNRFLAEYAARYAPDVVMVPTSIELGPFSEDKVRAARARRRERGGAPRLGWIGSRPSLRYLAGIAAPLRTLCARVPGARLVQICNDFVDLPGVPTEKTIWSAEREAADLLDLDLGLMPLDDSPFSQGKCGLKILQYHAAGLPVVCSPVGTNHDLVSQGETGMFARTDEEWAAQIARVLSEPDLARSLGDRGRQRVIERYEAGAIGARLAEIVDASAG